MALAEAIDRRAAEGKMKWRDKALKRKKHSCWNSAECCTRAFMGVAEIVCSHQITRLNMISAEYLACVSRDAAEGESESRGNIFRQNILIN